MAAHVEWLGTVGKADPNYITRRGARKLASELELLLHRERPSVVQQVAEAAAQGDRSENAEYIYGKRRLRELDRRIRFLTGRLEKAHVVETTGRDDERVFFGARVVVEDDEGRRFSYQLVGEDETQPARGEISWRSPIGRALMRREPGDVVTVRRPAGDLSLEIISVSFRADDD